MIYANMTILGAFALSFLWLDQIKMWVSANVINVYSDPGYTAWGLASVVMWCVFALIWFATILNFPLFLKNREDAL